MESVSPFLEYHVTYDIYNLLQRQPKKRLQASLVSHIFSFYCKFLDSLIIVQDAFLNGSFPSYQEWRELIESQEKEDRNSFKDGF